MPCSAVARGMAAPAAYPGFTAPATQALPFADAINNTPCARRIISTANGVSFAAHSLCLFHLRQKLGDLDVQAPYVDAA